VHGTQPFAQTVNVGSRLVMTNGHDRFGGGLPDLTHALSRGARAMPWPAQVAPENIHGLIWSCWASTRKTLPKRCGRLPRSW
jgi:hypothetical protein